MLNCEDSGFYCPQRPMVLVIRELGWLDTHHKPHLLGGSSNLFRSCLFSSTTLSLNCMCSQSLGRDVGSQDLGIPLSLALFLLRFPSFSPVAWVVLAQYSGTMIFHQRVLHTTLPTKFQAAKIRNFLCRILLLWVWTSHQNFTSFHSPVVVK